MALPSDVLAIVPGKSLGPFVLGQTMFHTLNNLDPIFTKVQVCYPDQNTFSTCFIVNLPNNGIRLRFRTTDQHLILIEVTDFKKCALSYNNKKLIVHPDSTGPGFQYLYNHAIGYTNPGTFIKDEGLYILSYCGLAFSFPLEEKRWDHNADFVSLLRNVNAVGLTVFFGESWKQSCEQLLTSNIACTDDLETIVNHVTIECPGKVVIHRAKEGPFTITLNETTVEDIILELGPPATIYPKRQGLTDNLIGFESGDTPIKDSGSGGDDDTPGDRFMNYFHYGFDIMLGPAISQTGEIRSASGPRLSVIKVILHGNIPGTYDFNRYKRCQWTIDSIQSSPKPVHLTSEMGFQTLVGPLKEAFASMYSSAAEAARFQTPTSRDRSRADSPTSSVEMLRERDDEDGRNNGIVVSLQMFGFPGLIFEIVDMAVGGGDYKDRKDRPDCTQVATLIISAPRS